MKLTVKNLSVWRGSRVVIEDQSFDVQAGEVLLVKGKNGSGKTTLLRALAGLIRPENGEVALLGTNDDAPLADHCHYVGHLNAVKATQTVWETVEFHARFLNPDADRGDTRSSVDHALERFSLSQLASVPSGYLSAGQKRRLGLARLLSAPRPIWFLDEPTTSLDQQSAEGLASVINEHVDDGGMVIAATHLDLSLAQARTLQLDADARAP